MLNTPEADAAALYDGGWRSKNREDLMSEYDLTEDEASEICRLLEEIEATQGN